MDPARGEPLIHQEYTRMALLYEERVVPRFAPIARRTVALAGLAPGERVLDVGAGTGLATFLAADAVGPGGEVVGFDASEGQLGIAEALRQRKGLRQVRFQRGDALRLPFEAGFDAAVSNLGIPPDFAPAFAGMRRALRPGGRMSVTTWSGERQGVFDDLREAITARLVPDPPAELANLRDVVRERRRRMEPLGQPDALARALRAAGLDDVEVARTTYEVPFGGWRAAYDFGLSWGVQESEVRAMPGPEREALQAHLRGLWGERAWTAPWHLLHATGRR